MRRSPPMASNLNSIPSPRGYARRVGRMRPHAIRVRSGKLSVRAQSCGFSRVPENKKGTAETVPCLMRVLHAYTLCESDPFQSQAALKLRFLRRLRAAAQKLAWGFAPNPTRDQSLDPPSLRAASSIFAQKRLTRSASTCSAGSGSRRPRSRSCSRGRCAWAWPERVRAPASSACSSGARRGTCRMRSG